VVHTPQTQPDRGVYATIGDFLRVEGDSSPSTPASLSRGWVHTLHRALVYSLSCQGGWPMVFAACRAPTLGPEPGPSIEVVERLVDV
jgi:hypothetical protein